MAAPKTAEDPPKDAPVNLHRHAVKATKSSPPEPGPPRSESKVNELESALARAEEAEARLATVEARVDELESNLYETEQTALTKEQERKDAHDALQAAEELLSDRDKEVRALTTQKDELQALVERMQADASKGAQDLHDARTAAHTTAALAEALHAKISTTLKAAEDAKKDAESKASTVQELEGRLGALDQEVSDLTERLHETEEAVIEQEEEIQELEARQKKAQAPATRKGKREAIDKAVDKERKRLEKRHANELEDQAATHASAMAQLEERQVEDVRDQDAELLHAEERIAELKEEVAHWKDEVHRVNVRMEAVVEQASRDVAEAELHGKVRARSKEARDKAIHALPKSVREAMRQQAEDSLWDKQL